MSYRAGNSRGNTGRGYSQASQSRTSSGTHFDSHGNSSVSHPGNSARETHTSKIRQADLKKIYDSGNEPHVSSRALSTTTYGSNNSKPGKIKEYNSRSISRDGYPDPSVSHGYGYGYDDSYRNDQRDRYYDNRYDNRSYNNYGKKKPKKKKKAWKVILFILLGLFVILLACAGLVASHAYKQYTALKTDAESLKDELKSSITYVKDMSYSKLSDSIDKIDDLSESINTTMEDWIWEYAEKIPEYGEDVAEVQSLLEVVAEVSDEILKPFCAQIKDNSIDNIKVDDGYNVKIIISYLDLLDEMIPNIKEISEDMSKIHLASKPGLIEEYVEMLDKLVATYEEYEVYIPLIRTILNCDEPRLYLLAAQNSAEIRASDGFPGSFGTIRINDGIMTIGDFVSVYDVMDGDYYVPDTTYKEQELFGPLYALYARDACFNPDFERVAQIWSDSYMDKCYEYVDGVISLTPAIIQELLKVCGEITVSDGTVLNGSNATKILQHDWYYQYISGYTDYEMYMGNAAVDSLFAETAKTVMGMVTEDLSIDKLKGLVEVLVNGQSERTILMWMADAEEEEIMDDFGYSGRLNDDPNDPVAGVYFSFADPCKLGWFLNIDTRILDSVQLEDGRMQYSVKVSFTNNVSWEEANVGAYVAGDYNGTMAAYVYFFAPCGGSIFNFETSDWSYITEDYYDNLNLGYRQNVMINPGETIDVTYSVITAEGVTEPLRIETTPTLQKYREAAEAEANGNLVTVD